MMTTATRTTLSATTLVGDSVRNMAGEDLGTIKDIMLDLDSGHIAYAVLSFGGFLGLGDKLFAVPWNALQLDAPNHAFIFDVDKETLKNAEGFDKDHWPDMADTDWGMRIHEFYGTRPYWE
jgi:sporulation protein YlmC with PRC-barrel domain